MHEVGLMQIALTDAKRNGSACVHALTMRIGPLAGVEIEALRLAFEVVPRSGAGRTPGRQAARDRYRRLRAARANCWVSILFTLRHVPTACVKPSWLFLVRELVGLAYYVSSTRLPSGSFTTARRPHGAREWNGIVSNNPPLFHHSSYRRNVLRADVKWRCFFRADLHRNVSMAIHFATFLKLSAWNFMISTPAFS